MPDVPSLLREAAAAMNGSNHTYHAFGLIGTALSKNVSIVQPSSLKVVPITPSASYATAGYKGIIHRVGPKIRKLTQLFDRKSRQEP